MQDNLSIYELINNRLDNKRHSYEDTGIQDNRGGAVNSSDYVKTKAHTIDNIAINRQSSKNRKMHLNSWGRLLNKSSQTQKWILKKLNIRITIADQI